MTQGSSPLTRGKPRTHGDPARTERLIPAHAGKTRHQRRLSPTQAAHPRSRGENWQYTTVIVSVPGSSPLTRGKPGPLTDSPSRPRLIPAHAGKTRHSQAR